MSSRCETSFRLANQQCLDTFGLSLRVSRAPGRTMVERLHFQLVPKEKKTCIARPSRVISYGNGSMNLVERTVR